MKKTKCCCIEVEGYYDDTAAPEPAVQFAALIRNAETVSFRQATDEESEADGADGEPPLINIRLNSNEGEKS